MPLKTTKWDAADYLETADDAAGYLAAILEEGDTSLFYAALGDVARSEGMTEVAKRAGMSRESLYKALSGNRKPEFETVQKVVSALGLKMTVGVAKPAPEVEAGAPPPPEKPADKEAYYRQHVA